MKIDVTAIPEQKLVTGLAESFKRLRIAHDMTQSEVGKVIGVGRTSVTNMEIGRQPVLIEYLDTLAKHLGYEIKITLIRTDDNQ